jgi:tRNA1(Val) A37 N6-methylase TrmN6
LTRTEGTLLGGKLRYAQFAQGYRTALEPVLLAASIPAKPGDRVLEGGTGAGAGLLCLAARVPIAGVGVEQDEALAALARDNLAANGLRETLSVVAGDITDATACTGCDGPFDHAFANPPWHDAASTPSPEPGRKAAKQASPGLLHAWAEAMGGRLRAGGTLSLIVPAAGVMQASAALSAAGCPCELLYPLWPKAGRAAKLVIVRGVRRANVRCDVQPGLILHSEDGKFTPEAEAILRQGARLEHSSRDALERGL